VEIIKDELNVKDVLFKSGDGLLQVKLDATVTPSLKREGMAREVIRVVQNARKKAGLNVDDRIDLSLSTTDKSLRQAVEEHKDSIASETLSAKLTFDRTFEYEETTSVDSASLTVSLQARK